MINISNSYIFKQVLSLTQTGCHDNVTIVCSNATVLSWPQYFQCSEISWMFDDRFVIVIPDLAVGELEIFLHNMYQHKVVFVVSKDVVELMRPIGLSSVEDTSDLHNYRDKDTDIDIDSWIKLHL